jgi:hypothetical protein
MGGWEFVGGWRLWDRIREELREEGVGVCLVVDTWNYEACI